MPLIFVGTTVESYMQAYENRTIVFSRVCPNPECGGKLHKHGHYMRQAERNGDVVDVPVQRMRCASCQKTCSFLPSIFIARHSMTTPERECVAKGMASDSRCAA